MSGHRGPAEPPSSLARRLGRPRDWLIGGGLLVGLLLAIQATVGWPALLRPWLTLAPSLLGALVLLTSATWLLRAVRVYDYLGPQLAGHFPTLLRVSLLHNAANNLLPMRTGELVFPWLMRRCLGHGLLDATAALIWIRILDLHLLALAGLWILHQAAPSWLWPLLMLLWLALLVPVTRLARGAIGRKKIDREHWMVRLPLTIAAAAPRKTGMILRLYLWTVLIWGLKLAAFATLLQHFVPVHFWQVLTGVLGAELSSVLPFHGIAGAGSYELATVAALVPLGIDPELALTGAVNLHLFVLGITLLLGTLAFLLPCGQDIDPRLGQ